MRDIELTILIPCLNEEKTIETCINKAKKFIDKENINGEILIIDNNCTDNTAYIAKQAGARVEKVERKGYGSALIEGTKLARGKYTIMGDADDSYNFLELQPFIKELKNGNDLVIGNRYKGKMEKGAMKWSHKYIGTPIISFLGKILYNIPASDFNCGLRGYNTERIINLNCQAEGMEYATEMLIRAKRDKLKIKEIAINFYKDKREKGSNLNTIRDGIRHFKQIIGGTK